MLLYSFVGTEFLIANAKDRYMTAIFEATCVFGISSIWRLRQKKLLTFIDKPDPWRIVSFEHTHLVERMGLLTLIILGEGIIVMLKAINAIVKGVDWTRGLAGIVIAALSIIVSAIPLHYPPPA